MTDFIGALVGVFGLVAAIYATFSITEFISGEKSRQAGPMQSHVLEILDAYGRRSTYELWTLCEGRKMGYGPIAFILYVMRPLKRAGLVELHEEQQSDGSKYMYYRRVRKDGISGPI